MIEESVHFYSEGVRIVGLLDHPNQISDSPVPGVILAHGYINSKDEFGGFKELAEISVNKGYIVLRFDFRGCGDSGAPIGRMLCGTEWPIDLMSAVSYMIGRPDVEADKIALIGQSLGGSTVSYVSAFDDRICCIISMAAVSDGEKWLRELWTQKKGEKAWGDFVKMIKKDRIKRCLSGKSEIASIPDLLAMDEEFRKSMKEWHKQYSYYLLEAPIESIDSVMTFRPVDVIHGSKCPILFIHGKSDILVDCSHSASLYERANEPKEIQLIEGAGHDLPIGEYKQIVQRYINKFLDENL